MKSISRIAVLALASALALVLIACGGTAGSSASSSSGSASTATAKLVGSPWVTSVLSGNLPAEQPAVKDDLYTHYNYDYLVTHQGQYVSTLSEHADDLQQSVLAIVKDESKTGHDLDQLRILFNQASDTEALQAVGLSEVQPYLDRIDAVESVDEMNALLLADDFPFSPFVTDVLTSIDTRANYVVGIGPDFVLCDAAVMGGTYYQDSDDPKVQENLEEMLQNLAVPSMMDLLAMGVSKDEIQDTMIKLIDFEKKHGKYLDSGETYLNADYGAMAEAARASHFTLDELCAMAPSFPLKETLDKLGKGNAETYTVTREWLEAFNGLWTEENLDAIKAVAKLNVLAETRPYRDPTPVNMISEASGMPVSDAESFAFTACTSLDTFGDAVAKIYVYDVLGENAKARLEDLSRDLVASYKDLVGNTTWMSEESRARIIEKLDHMTLNVLEPAGGYLDYGGLELTPTSQGGTLLSNYLKLKQYRSDYESRLVNQPVTTSSPWFMYTPTTVNAFYDQTSNSINIFPAYVTNAVYTDDMTYEDLLAGAGWTIGHEISHGFDYTGSQMDAYGAPNPVFADADVDAFVLKSSTLALYYNGIEITPDQMVNGQLVVGEAAADLSGLQACLEIAAKSEGFDYDKYFASVSRAWAEVMPEAYLKQQTLDVHPLNNLRVNVSAQMYDVIYDVFGVAEGDGMYLAPEERIVIWGPNA